MSSAYCLCSEEPLQELAWGCSPGAVRQVYGKLPGDLLWQQQLLTPFCSQGKVPGMVCPGRRVCWLGCLPRLQGGSWPKQQGGRNVFPSLAAGSIRFCSGNTSNRSLPCATHQNQTTTCCDPKWCLGLSQIRPGHP